MNANSKIPDNPLNMEELNNFRLLVKSTGVRKITLDKDEIFSILNWNDNITDIPSFESGYLNFRPMTVNLNHKNKTSRVYRVFARVEPDTITDENEMDYELIHYHYFFKVLFEIFDFQWFITKYVEEMTSYFIALPKGQASAVLKKLFPRIRDKGKVMSSTTRSQLHQLRQKIEKYRPLVNAFEPILLTTNASDDDSSSDQKRKSNRTIFRLVKLDKPAAEGLKAEVHKNREELLDEIVTLREKLLSLGIDPEHLD